MELIKPKIKASDIIFILNNKVILEHPLELRLWLCNLASTDIETKYQNL